MVSRNPENNYNMKNVEVISYEELSEIKGDILVDETPVGLRYTSK